MFWFTETKSDVEIQQSYKTKMEEIYHRDFQYEKFIETGWMLDKGRSRRLKTSEKYIDHNTKVFTPPTNYQTLAITTYNSSQSLFVVQPKRKKSALNAVERISKDKAFQNWMCNVKLINFSSTRQQLPQMFTSNFWEST